MAASPTRLPFNAIDEAVHLLDVEDEPWSVQFEVRVEGELDVDRLRRAVGEAVARHPLARARRVATRRSDHRLVWEIRPGPDVDPVGVVTCADDDALDTARADFQSVGVPLAEAPPFRLRLARHPGGDVLMLNANHAAFDGFGCVRLLQSVAAAYAGADDPPSAVDLEQGRDLDSLLAAHDAEHRARRLLVITEKLRDLAVPPARLASDGGRNQPGYGFCHVGVDDATTTSLVKREGPGTVNDVLLAALALAVTGWNDDHGASCRRVSILFPVNLRPKEWSQDVVSNFSLPVRLSVPRQELSSPEAAVAAVAARTGETKRAGTGAALMELVGRLPDLPIWAKRSLATLVSLSGQRLVDTALLTNVGRIDDPPSFGADAGETTEVWFSAPAKVPMSLSVGALSAGGRLHLVVRYRHPLFGADAARRFADRYRAALDLFAG